MKAFLLAAGSGERLRPLTDALPKCLAPICGRPLLEIWLELLGNSGIDEVLINTRHLASKIEAFATHWPPPPRIRLTFEPSLLGSAGTLRENWGFIGGEPDFLVCYADNLTDIDLRGLVEFHRSRPALVTMALFRSETPAECGIAMLGEGGRILSFEEKPTKPKSCLANAGIYVMRRDIRAVLPGVTPADIGFDLLPRCLGRMYGLLHEGLHVDIGNPTRHAWAQVVWNRRPIVNGLARTPSHH